MKHILLFILLTGLAATQLSATTVKHSNDIPNGPYQSSCKDIHVVHDGNNMVTFSATCPDKSGHLWETTYVSARDIPGGWENINGNLYTEDSIPGGSWLQTCSAGGFNATEMPFTSLSATCKAKDGSYKTSTLDIQGHASAYSDENGVLQCMSNDCGFGKK